MLQQSRLLVPSATALLVVPAADLVLVLFLHPFLRCSACTLGLADVRGFVEDLMRCCADLVSGRQLV